MLCSVKKEVFSIFSILSKVIHSLLRLFRCKSEYSTQWRVAGFDCYTDAMLLPE